MHKTLGLVWAGMLFAAVGASAQTTTVPVGGPPPAMAGKPKVSAPMVLFAPEPQYTKEARRENISGNVLVGCDIDVNGKPINIRVITGLGHGLDERAIAAVKQYRFKPAMENGQPVQVQMKIAVNFQIFERL